MTGSGSVGLGPIVASSEIFELSPQADSSSARTRKARVIAVGDVADMARAPGRQLAAILRDNGRRAADGSGIQPAGRRAGAEAPQVEKRSRSRPIADEEREPQRRLVQKCRTGVSVPDRRVATHTRARRRSSAARAVKVAAAPVQIMRARPCNRRRTRATPPRR